MLQCTVGRICLKTTLYRLIGNTFRKLIANAAITANAAIAATAAIAEYQLLI